MERDYDHIRITVRNRMKKLRISKNPEYFENLIVGLIKNNQIPEEVVDIILQSPAESNRTKFDHLFNVVMSFGYPGYSNKLMSKIGYTEDDMKLWKVTFPPKYNISSILIRAKTMQDAFALGSDYISRVSVRLFQELPKDITMKVSYCSEKSLRKLFGLREINKKRQRAIRNTKEREFTARQIQGVRISALGHEPEDPRRSIARYHDKSDLDVLQRKGIIKTTPIEKENYTKLTEIDTKM